MLGAPDRSRPGESKPNNPKLAEICNQETGTREQWKRLPRNWWPRDDDSRALPDAAQNDPVTPRRGWTHRPMSAQHLGANSTELHPAQLLQQ